MEKTKEILKNLDSAIEKIKNKEQKIIFLVPDTKGNAKSSVMHIYSQALTLKKMGYNVSILHEKNDFIKVGSWYGAECDELEHMSIEDNNLVVGPSDFIIVPEVYGSVFALMFELVLRYYALMRQPNKLMLSITQVVRSTH